MMTDTMDMDHEELRSIDHHIKSVTSLAQVLWYSGDAPAEGGKNLTEKTPDTVAILTNLALALNRLPKENVAVGLLSAQRIAVSASSDPTHFQGTYATNISPTKSKKPTTPPHEKGTLDREALLKLAYSYRFKTNE